MSSSLNDLTERERSFMEEAIAQARQSLTAGGVPIGAAMARGRDLLAVGHNQRVQRADPIAHAEMDCLRNAGRLKTYRDVTLFTTLSPCMMCSGTIVQFKIPRVIVGENRTFGGNEEFLRSRGVEVIVLDENRCIAMMEEFQRRSPELWKEDIGED
jgi:cytosine/creatinine deaminase